MKEETFPHSRKPCHSWGQGCQISERRSFTDKTLENNFDPEFPTYKIKAFPTLDNKYVVWQQDLDELPTTLTTPTISAAPATH